MNTKAFQNIVKKIAYGKKLPTAKYIIRPEQFDDTDPLHIEIIRAMEAANPPRNWNLLKLHLTEYSITFLLYPDFDKNPHPSLQQSTKINLNTGRIVRIDYSNRANPPILHRKETFLPESNPKRALYSKLTQQEEEAGLYRNTTKIGNKLYWESLLKKLELAYDGHELISINSDKKNSDYKDKVVVERHRTAIKRYDLSRPVKLLLKHGILSKSRSFFDYGCGHGMDIEALTSLGYSAAGWDPVFCPTAKKQSADIVNVGYVLNVIEIPEERDVVIKKAFELTKHALLVSTLISGQESVAHTNTYGDGYITKTGTFQKFYKPGELEVLLECTIKVEPITLAPGVCLVFRNEIDKESYVARQNRRRIDWSEIGAQLQFTQPSSRSNEQIGTYELHSNLLQPLWEKVLDLGRLPEVGEFDDLSKIKSQIGSLKKAFNIACNYHGLDLYKEARKLRNEDLLTYLAMKRFQKKFNRKDIPLATKRDIKAFWGTNSIAFDEANKLLFASGDPDEIEIEIKKLTYGWIDEHEGHFTFHRSLLDKLPAILRIYVLCGVRLFGDLDEIDLIKIHIRSRKLTLHKYDDYLGANLPILVQRIKIDLRKFFVTVFDYETMADKQLLYFKERFVDDSFQFKNNTNLFSKRLEKLGFSKDTIAYGPTFNEFKEFKRSRNLSNSLVKKKNI